jgi:hypothetical protein
LSMSKYLKTFSMFSYDIFELLQNNLNSSKLIIPFGKYFFITLFIPSGFYDRIQFCKTFRKFIMSFERSSFFILDYVCCFF